MNVEREACTPTAQGQTSVSPMMTLPKSSTLIRVPQPSDFVDLGSAANMHPKGYLQEVRPHFPAAYRRTTRWLSSGPCRTSGQPKPPRDPAGRAPALPPPHPAGILPIALRRSRRVRTESGGPRA